MAAKIATETGNARIIKTCDRTMEIFLYLIFFLIPIVFIIYTRDQFELPKLTVLRILTSLMLGTWAIRALAAGKLNLRRTPLDLPILVWVGLQVLTTLISASGFVSYRGEYENFRGLLTVLNYPLLYYMAVNFIRTRAQINRLLFVILATGLVVTAYGAAQFFGIDFIRWNPTSIAPGRYFSTLGNPNFLAAYLAMVMPLLVVFFVETKSTFRRVLLFISFIVMFLALMGTWSRGGLLGLVAALSVLAGFGLIKAYRYFRSRSADPVASPGALALRTLKRYPQWTALLALTLVLIVAISATFGRQHMLRMFDTIVHFKEAVKVSRLHIWGPAWGMIKDHPLLGTGLDTFKTVFPRYATPAFAAIDGANVSSRTAHNEILQVLATQGLIGLIIVTWLTVMFLINWWKAYARSLNHWQDHLVLIGLLASWTAYSVQNLFSFGVVSIDTFYWLILALTVLLGSSPEKQVQAAPAQTPVVQPSGFFTQLRRFRLPLILLTVFASFWFSWQAFKNAVADYAFNLGTVYRMRGMWEYCLQGFSRAAELTPTEVKYVVYQGLAYEEKAKIAPPAQQLELVHKALASYKRGVEMNPTNAYYLGNLGRAYSLASRLDPQKTEYFDQAVHYFKQAVHYAPVTVLFYQNLAMTYFSHGQDQLFNETMDSLAAFNSSQAAQLVFSTGNQAYNEQRFDQARRFYEKAIALNPEYVEAYFNLGVVLAQTVGPAQAIPQWQKALELKPDFSPAREMLKRYQGQGARSPSQVIFNP